MSIFRDTARMKAKLGIFAETCAICGEWYDGTYRHCLSKPVNNGDQRTRKKFAWFPTEMINGKMVWWEEYNIREEWNRSVWGWLPVGGPWIC